MFVGFDRLIVMKTLGILIFILIPSFLYSQQIPDTLFRPIINSPAYDLGEGPIVFIDEGHHNYHTKNGRYKAFSILLERDGYIVKEYNGEFEQAKLANGKILVISNARNEFNIENRLVPGPSAFTKTEIEVLKKWVQDGGSLFLIADHMPFAGAAHDLAAAFGFEFTDGVIADTVNGTPSYFRLYDNTLNECVITKGRDNIESVEQIVAFTGQGFSLPEDAIPILLFDENHVNMFPDTIWVFNEDTPKSNAKGLSQGAYKSVGAGKVVAFGEAAMFTALLVGPEKESRGMNDEVAPENYQLLLNIIHWLDGRLE